MFDAKLNVIIDPQPILDGIKLTVRNKAMRKALVAASKPIVDAAKEQAPQDTGGLRFGLGSVVKVKGTEIAYAKIGVKSKYTRQKKGVTRRPVRYFHIVEAGGKYHAPQPFLTNGFDANEAQETIRQVILNEIRGIVGGTR